MSRYFRGNMSQHLDLENYRGKYVCAQEILILDWRLRRGDVYEVSGTRNMSTQNLYHFKTIFLQLCARGRNLMLSTLLTGFLGNSRIKSWRPTMLLLKCSTNLKEREGQRCVFLKRFISVINSIFLTRTSLT